MAAGNMFCERTVEIMLDAKLRDDVDKIVLPIYVNLERRNLS